MRFEIPGERSATWKDVGMNRRYFFSADVEEESTPHADFVYPEIDHF